MSSGDENRDDVVRVLDESREKMKRTRRFFNCAGFLF